MSVEIAAAFIIGAFVYHPFTAPRVVPRLPETPPRLDAAARARLALARIRKLLTAYLPGMFFDPASLAARIEHPLGDAILEAERHFALGWLHWLSGKFQLAAPSFDEAMLQCQAPDATGQLAQAAYWRARVGILCEEPDALPNYEQKLRSLGGSPQATAWFVDLLWRAGRVDRAEQVWRSVRANRKVTACDEGPLLDARGGLRRGDSAQALKILDEATPANGVVHVERLLLKAWALADQKHVDQALALWKEAAAGPYPALALASWRERIEGRSREIGDTLPEPTALPPPLRALMEGHRHRLAGQTAEASAAYRTALTQSAVQTFARYALATMGEEDFGSVLQSQPGLFLTVRARLWLARERFRRREIKPVEFLDAIQQAASQNYSANGPLEPLRTIAIALDSGNISELTDLLGTKNTDSAGRRNAVHAAAEIVMHTLPPPEGAERLAAMAREEDNSDLRTRLARSALGLFLRGLKLDGDNRLPEGLAALLPNEPLLGLVGAAPTSSLDDSSALVRLARLARELAEKETNGIVVGDDALASWREQVKLTGVDSSRHLGLALLVHEAGRRHDLEAVLALLADLDAWRRFRPAPPTFAVRAVAATASAQPNHPGWRLALPPWLAIWGAAGLGGFGTILAGVAGITIADALLAPPPGTAAGPWFLHRAARAVERDDSRAALACMRRALADLSATPPTPVVQTAFPEIERRAHAQSLAQALCPIGLPPLPSALLVDAVDLLMELPDGASQLDSPVPREMLAERADLPPRLNAHLALADFRAALFLETKALADDAITSWRRAWDHWLRFLVGPEAPADGAGALVDHLLGLHRQRLMGLLARGDVDEANSIWLLILSLPARAGEIAPGLAALLHERVARWRDDLATAFLLSTREAMRFGDVPQGLRADYAKGLAALRRHLSLDQENVRLLTALVEICNDWFLDVYHAPDLGDLSDLVGRFTPSAQDLARLIDAKPGELPARAVLADFWKFRGFTTFDRASKRAFYEEALEFNPGNNNVRELLAGLDEKTE